MKLGIVGAAFWGVRQTAALTVLILAAMVAVYIVRSNPKALRVSTADLGVQSAERRDCLAFSPAMAASSLVRTLKKLHSDAVVADKVGGGGSPGIGYIAGLTGELERHMNDHGPIAPELAQLIDTCRNGPWGG